MNRSNNNNNTSSFICAVALLFVVSNLCITTSVNAEDVHPPLVIGHRGFPIRAPENTMPSFILAQEKGVDGLETDLRYTKDGVLVCLHDVTLDRTTNCTGKLSDYTWEELQNCDASYNFPEYKGTKIPKFSEVVEFAQQHGLFIIMDYKSEVPYAKTVYEIATNFSGGNNETRDAVLSSLVGSCWYPWQLTDIYDNLKGSPVQFLTGGVNWGSAGFWHTAVNSVVRGFSINYNNISKSFVENAHKRLMSVTVWTPVSSDDLKKVISWGVDAIITDDCATLVDILHWTPPPGPNNISGPSIVQTWVVGVVAVIVFVVTTGAVGFVVHIRTKRSLYSLIRSQG